MAYLCARAPAGTEKQSETVLAAPRGGLNPARRRAAALERLFDDKRTGASAEHKETPP